MTIVEAMKSAITAAGGTATGDTIAELFAAYTAAVEAAEIPAFTETENGKFLGVADGALAWATVAAELPAYSASENGKVLGVVDGALAWVDKDDPAPAE